ncbi:hypothetical protein I7I53_01948 [Histoplasma capsulatum var. duboisii H88]|uniref:Uncharacterized protein n=1 Tax=Ajellomyces capsulatus (strain H88) TaxID=544711 RepID=A0A8A1LPQ2_AJEC8|nr:hypothetical protein I7I53_01948 [Histoplasma capsulatum var. duboisii H88]
MHGQNTKILGYCVPRKCALTLVIGLLHSYLAAGNMGPLVQIGIKKQRREGKAKSVGSREFTAQRQALAVVRSGSNYRVADNLLEE